MFLIFLFLFSVWSFESHTTVQWVDCPQDRRSARSHSHVDVQDVQISDIAPKINDVFYAYFKGKITEGTLRKPKASVQLMKRDRNGKWKKFLTPYHYQLCSLDSITCPITKDTHVEFEIGRQVPSLLSTFLSPDNTMELQFIATVKEKSQEVACIKFELVVKK